MRLVDGQLAPRGFKTDGASVPRLARALAGKFGDGFAEAIQHDWGYYCQARERKYYDEQYRDCLLNDPDFPNWKAHVYYRMLRMFGGFAWKANAKRSDSYFFEDLDR